MLSLNRGGQEEKIEQNWKSVLELWIFEVLVNPYYGHLQFGSSARICDVIFIKNIISGYVLF